MARVHGPLVDHDGRQVVHVLGRVDTLLVLLHRVWQHVERDGEVDMAIHLLGGGLVVLVSLMETD